MKTIMTLGDRASELLLDTLNQRIVRELVFTGYSIAELSRRLNIPPLKIWRRIQKLALRFPSDIGSVAGFTSDRIDSMAEVLQEYGASTADIDQKIGDPIQATDSADNPDNIATDADIINCHDGGGIKVGFDNQNRMYLYSDKGTMQWTTGTFRLEIVPGFKDGTATLLKVSHHEAGISVYHFYSGGEQWIPTAPGDVVQPGDEETVSFWILTRDDFIQDLPQVDFSDPIGINWVADASQLTDYSLEGDKLRLGFAQQPAVGDDSTFSMSGKASDTLGQGSVSGVYMDLQITDIFGNDRTLRIYYQGYGEASFGISIGAEFAHVDLIAFDGVRQVIVYDRPGPTGDYHEAVLYPVAPSGLYSLGEMTQYQLPYQVSGYSRSFFIDDVGTVRSMEYEMGTQGSPSDGARIGAEIGYAVAIDELGLHDVVMIDPSQPGPDLYTGDGKVVIEARMLQRTVNEVGTAFDTDVRVQLTQMVQKVEVDFSQYPTAQTGYVVLTYVDNEMVIHTIVLEVLP
jgi:hypothetical protein